MLSSSCGYFQIPEECGEFVAVFVSQLGTNLRISGRGGTPAAVKSGEYSFVDIRIYREDAFGDCWSVRTVIPSGLKIPPDETVSLPDLKGPDRAYIRMVPWVQGYYSLDFRLEDGTGRRYTYFRKNGEKLAPPGFVLSDKEGSFLFSGSFSYG